MQRGIRDDCSHRSRAQICCAVAACLSPFGVGRAGVFFALNHGANTRVANSDTDSNSHDGDGAYSHRCAGRDQLGNRRADGNRRSDGDQRANRNPDRYSNGNRNRLFGYAGHPLSDAGAATAEPDRDPTVRQAHADGDSQIVSRPTASRASR